MPQPIDQGAILRSGAALIPNLSEQILQEQLLSLRQQAQQTNQQQENRLLAAQTREAANEDAFQQAVAALGENPTARDLAGLMYRFPQMSEAINRGFTAMDRDMRRREFQTLAEITSAARGGHFDLAAQTLERRVTADREAGQPEDPMDTAILNALRSEDPAERQFAVDLLERSTAAVDPDHYASTYGTFQRQTREVDGIVYDAQTGEALFQSPYPRIISGPNGSFFQQDRVPTIPVLGGAAASGGQAPQQGDTQPQTGNTGNSWAVISRPGAARDGGARVHQGYDITPPAGRPEWRPDQSFRIENPRNGARQGYTADVILEDGTRIVAMHLRELPRPGNYNAGDIAVIAGNTGNARNTPTHIHAEATRNGERVDPSPYFGAGAAAPVRISSRQQYERLASGAEYIAPDGSRRRKP